MSSGIYCSPKERESFAVNLRSASTKIFSFKKNETVYTIRLLPVGGFVRIGEDPEMIEVKPGYTVGLLLIKMTKWKKSSLIKRKNILTL